MRKSITRYGSTNLTVHPVNLFGALEVSYDNLPCRPEYPDHFTKRLFFIGKVWKRCKASDTVKSVRVERDRFDRGIQKHRIRAIAPPCCLPQHLK